MMDVPGPFVHLDVRSCFSLKEGAFTPEQLARRAAELGMPAVALTDRDGLYGAARFVNACEQRGREARSSAPRSPFAGRNACAAARGSRHADSRGRRRRRPARAGRRGYANLCRLITDAHMLGERGDPSVDAEQICAHAARARRAPRAAFRAGRLAVAGRVDAAARAPTRSARRSAPNGARRRRTSGGARTQRGGPRDAAVRRTAGVARRRDEPGALPGARGRVPRRRARVHARDRADRRQPRHARERRGLAEAGGAMRALFAERPDLCDATLGSPRRARSTWG